MVAKSKKMKCCGFAIAIIHILISVYGDNQIFNSSHIWKEPLYLAFKPIACFLIVLFWCKFMQIAEEIKHKNSDALQFTKVFIFYFSIMMFFLLLTWPGVWRSDDANILSVIVNLKFCYWHHWLTDAFYIISLSIIAVPVGIVIIQLIIISLIVAFIVTETKAVITSKWTNLLYIPFFLPTIIDSNLNPLRSSLLAFFEVLFIFLIVRKKVKKEKLSTFDVVSWSLLISVIAMWRTEGIYYLVLGPILIAIVLLKYTKLRKILYITIISILLCMGIRKVQSTDPQAGIYPLSAVISHLEAIVTSDYRTDDKEADMKAIYDVFPGWSGTNYHYGLYLVKVSTPKTDEAFDKRVAALEKVYIKMILHNPEIYIKDSVKLFLRTNSMWPPTGSGTMIGDSSSAFDKGYTYGTLAKNRYGTYKLITPINKRVRALTIRILECRGVHDYFDISIMSSILYNVLPSLIILIVAMLCGLVKRNKYAFFIAGFLLVRPALVFATAPVEYFMYYMPTYLSGYLFFIYWLILRKTKCREIGAKDD